MKKQVGFTLVELVVVIAVLGILAATALPRFINVNSSARLATIKGVAAGMRSAVGLVQAQWQASGASGTSVTMADGTTVTVGSYGIPVATSAGITAAAQLDANTLTITYSGTTVTVQPSGGSATCQAVYSSSTGDVSITATTSGCS